MGRATLGHLQAGVDGSRGKQQKMHIECSEATLNSQSINAESTGSGESALLQSSALNRKSLTGQGAWLVSKHHTGLIHLNVIWGVFEGWRAPQTFNGPLRWSHFSCSLKVQSKCKWSDVCVRLDGPIGL